MSASIVLDTSAYSMLRRGRTEILDVLASASRVHVPATVLGELQAGFRLGRRLEDNLARLEECLAEEEVEVVPIDEVVAEEYGRTLSRPRRTGTPIPTNDIWIAACADRVGARPVTHDPDLHRIPDLDPQLLGR